MHRESLENLGSSRSSEKHVRLVFAKEALESPNTSSHSGPGQVLHRCCGSVVSWLFYWCGVKLTRDAGIDRHIVRLLRQRNTCSVCWPWRPARVRTLQGKAERSLCIAGKVAGKFVQHPRGFSDSSGRNKEWNFNSESSAVCTSLLAMLTHPGIFSSFGSQHFTEVSLCSRRGMWQPVASRWRLPWSLSFRK